MDVAAQHSVEAKPGANDELDAILDRDPAGAYPRMDARSRRDYRTCAEDWAARSRRAPAQAAQTALELAIAASQRHGRDDRRAHVGYFLLDRGVGELADALGVSLDARERIRLAPTPRKLALYYAAFFSVCLLYGLLSVRLFAFRLPPFGHALMVVLAALYLCPILQSWINMAMPRVLRSRRLPRLDFAAGLPARAQTLVAVPCLLTSRESAHKLARALETLYLDNRDAGAGYALLSDFVDAPDEHAPGEDALLQEACAQISALNERYGGGFALLHRPRRWNPNEGVWMGWERKRGKIEELNAYLLGGPSPFRLEHGDLSKLTGTKYVFVLDEDNSDLTAGAVQQLAAVLEHPLQRPAFAADGITVEAGYVLVQPRATVVLSKDSRPSRLEILVQSMIQIETGKPHDDGLPPVDANLELFGQVPYVGKGFYDVAHFHRIMHGRVPENSTLNHDVLEGGTVRAAVVGDIVLRDTFTPRCYSAVNRLHRWMRGDRQLLPWLLPHVRNAAGERIVNALSPFARWQIFYNAVRMLFPSASLLCFALGWASSPTPGGWTLYLLAVAWVPALVELAPKLLRNLRASRLRATASGAWSWLCLRSASFLFGVDQAHNSLDAALRCSYRMLVSHRRMLEWTASSVVSARDPGLAQYLRMMWSSPAVAIAVTGVVAWVNPRALSSALPFATMWFFAPFIAWWWSQKPDRQVYPAIQSAPP